MGTIQQYLTKHSSIDPINLGSSEHSIDAFAKAIVSDILSTKRWLND